MERILIEQIIVSILAALITWLAEIKRESKTNPILTYRLFFNFTRKLQVKLHILVILLAFCLLPYVDLFINLFYPEFKNIEEANLFFILVVSSGGYDAYKKAYDWVLLKTFKKKPKK